MQNPSSQAPSTILVTSIKRVLRPLVGFLLDNGLTYTWLTRLLKSVYVEVAEREFSLEGKEQTNSRLSLLTGVHRKDVAVLRNSQQTDQIPAAGVLNARLIAKWTGDNRYVGDTGNARPLTRLANAEGKPSFDELVSSTSKDIRPRAVLDEWVRLGIVELDAADMVHLKQEAFVPSQDHEQKTYFLGKNVGDHLAAARLNTGNPQPQYLERSVYYDDLSPESLEKLSAMAREHAMVLLQTLNKEASRLQKQDQEQIDKSGFGRMNLGVYYYDESDPE